MKRKLIIPMLAILLAGSVPVVDAVATPSVEAAADDTWFWYNDGYRFGRMDAFAGSPYGTSSNQPPSDLTPEERQAWWDGYAAGWASAQ